MPAGTCKICGCTDDKACPDGCSWKDRSHEYCSRCVGWAVLHEGSNYEGVFPYGVVPILDTIPTVLEHPLPGRAPRAVFLIDLRRLDEDALMRIGTISAPLNGRTMDDFLAAVQNPKFRFPFAAEVTAAIIETVDLETAARCAEEFRATGGVAGAKREQLFIGVVAADRSHSPGGVSRG